jgi:hypothetical protein
VPYSVFIASLGSTRDNDSKSPHSLAYEIFCRFDAFPSSSSSPGFFFLLPEAVLLKPFVGWLDSRVGKDDVGVWPCEGVVCAEPGVDPSYRKSAKLVETAVGLRVGVQYVFRPALDFDIIRLLRETFTLRADLDLPSGSCLSFG